MILEFIPDIFKFEESFSLEGDSISNIISKLQEECPVNCDFAVGEKNGNNGIIFIGVIRLEEDCDPKWFEKTNRKSYKYD